MDVKTIPVKNAKLIAYLHTGMDDPAVKKDATRPAIVICPGGAYTDLSDREADPPAIKFLEMGLQVFVLYYSVGPSAGNKQPLTELASSVKLIRENAALWQIDVHKIIVCGFSAGGHLAASMGVHWNDPEIMQRCEVDRAEMLRPDAMILCYPVITAGTFAHKTSIENVSRGCAGSDRYWSLEMQVNSETPPTFLWHTMNDRSVPVENSFLFAAQLHRNGVPCECHFFRDGLHGLSIATEETGTVSRSVHVWLLCCQNWITDLFGSIL